MSIECSADRALKSLCREGTSHAIEPQRRGMRNSDLPLGRGASSRQRAPPNFYWKHHIRNAAFNEPPEGRSGFRISVAANQAEVWNLAEGTPHLVSEK